jgi:hypothetical protein
MNRFLGWVLAPMLALSPLAHPAQVAHAKPVDRHGSLLNRYNFPSASRGDRFAKHGLNLKVGIKGWRRFGKTIKRVAHEQKIDPYVLGAYCWVESGFDPEQDYSNGDKRALGLGSVQATDHPGIDPDRLQEPYTNLTITAREFRRKWRPHDMFGTVMDVWYPAWRSGRRIPNLGNAFGYMQLFSNRYFALLGLFGSN